MRTRFSVGPKAHLGAQKAKGEKMSRYSGKFDLADHLSGLGGWFDQDGKPVKFGEASRYYSDEMLDFIEFKRQTGGVIHQHKKVTVSEWNQEDVKNHCPGFNFTKHTRKIPDKRCRSGFREETYYTYTYYGKKYGSLKELNKKNVYITIDIHFNTLLDLIPYYPYIVSACSYDSDSNPESCVFISEKPYPIEQRDERLRTGGLIDNSFQHYQRDLIEHFRDVVLEYYNPEGREMEETLRIHAVDGHLLAYPSAGVDTAWKIDVVRDRHEYVFSLPKWDDGHKAIDVTNVWPDLEEGDTITVRFIRKDGDRGLDLH